MAHQHDTLTDQEKALGSLLLISLLRSTLTVADRLAKLLRGALQADNALLIGNTLAVIRDGFALVPDPSLFGKARTFWARLWALRGAAWIVRTDAYDCDHVGPKTEGPVSCTNPDCNKGSLCCAPAHGGHTYHERCEHCGSERPITVWCGEMDFGDWQIPAVSQ